MQNHGTRDGDEQRHLGAARQPLERSDPNSIDAAHDTCNMESRLGRTVALAGVAVLLAWIWFNPIPFPPPKSLDNWMSRGVLGERIWLAAKGKIAQHHHGVIRATTWVASLGALAWIIGLIWLNLPATLSDWWLP